MIPLLLPAMNDPCPTSPRAQFSRPPLERMLRIHQAIDAGRLPNATILARELEVSTKSIQRDRLGLC